MLLRLVFKVVLGQFHSLFTHLSSGLNIEKAFYQKQPEEGFESLVKVRTEIGDNVDNYVL